MIDTLFKFYDGQYDLCIINEIPSAAGRRKVAVGAKSVCKRKTLRLDISFRIHSQRCKVVKHNCKKIIGAHFLFGLAKVN